MVSHLSIRSLAAEYPELLKTIVFWGDTVSSRAGRTREVVGFHLTMTDPLACVVARDGFSRGFMEVEIAQ